MRLLKTAYVLLWFPKPSETFIFNEVMEFVRTGLPLSVFTLYGQFGRDLSPEMRLVPVPIERLGIPFLMTGLSDVIHWVKRKPQLVKELLRTIPMRRWCDMEAAGENCWAFWCGFHLARRFEEKGIQHIHAPWANGPATAAWVASRLTEIPFSFAAHAGDIYPPDGALSEKIRDAILVRTENFANVAHLRKVAPDQEDKIHVIYSGHPLNGSVQAAPLLQPPYHLLALGRFVPKKGFDVLIRACRILRERGLDFRLTLGGWGPLAKEYLRLTKELELTKEIHFPGFVRHDQVSEFLRTGHVFVMPSVVDPSGDRDGLPNVIIEALCHRLPVVATDVCGIPEVIQDGRTGLLIPQRNPGAIADAILKVVRDPGGALEMTERGLTLVFHQFDLRRNCHALLQLFDDKITSVS
jgi:colanic acid/amylovoran biosynthesis glycosyltransferase